MPNNELTILTGNGHPRLAERICDYLGVPLSDVAVGRFPDGEISVKINQDVRGRDIFIVQPTCPPVNENLMELLVMADAARRSSARRVTAVIPYYGYARKDRKDEGRVPITAKLVANTLVGAGVERVLALDLHATQIQGFFDIPVDHLFSFPVLTRHFEEKNLSDLVVCTSDVGGVRMALAFSNWLNAGLAIVEKRRLSAKEAEVGFVIGEVKGKNILIVDDMIATGGSLVSAAETLQEQGAKDVYAAAAHGVLVGPAVERLSAAPIKEVVVTDSIPLNDKAKMLGDQLRVLSVSELLGEAIRRIHTNQSISSLFVKK
jgi:ribose-phosphate pyrophosphokinase